MALDKYNPVTNLQKKFDTGEYGVNESPVKEQREKNKQKQMDDSFADAVLDANNVAIVYTGPDENVKNSERNRKAIALSQTYDAGKMGKSSVTLDEKTGAIVLTAPEGLLKDKDFQKYFPASTIKELSQLYQLNKNAKVPYSELKEDGSREDKEITIPEYVEKMNQSLQAYTKNAYYAQYLRNQFRKQEGIGDKIDKLSDIQMAVIGDTRSKVVQIPEFLRNAKYFEAIKDNIDFDGNVSAEDFNKAYNLDNMSREDIIALMAQIDGYLSGTWSDENTFIDEETGEVVYNKSNKDEMAKALALREYILANDPDGHWYQELALGVNTSIINFGYTFQDAVLKMTWIDTIAEVVDFGTEKMYGQGTGWHAWKDANAKAIDYFNQSQALAQDSTATIATLSQLGGFATGIAAGAWLGKKAGDVAGAAKTALGGVKTAQAAKAAAKGKEVFSITGSIAKAGKAAKTALTSTELAQAIKGARFMTKVMNTAEKAKLMTQVAKQFMNNHALLKSVLDFSTGFLMDTLHDAIMFDSRNMLEALTACDNETRQYWLNQMAENAAFYVPFEGSKSVLKYFSTAGNSKTRIGKVINAYTTKGVNKFVAKGSQLRGKFLDWIYEAEGGHKAALDKKYKKLISKNHNLSAERIAKKLNMLNHSDEIMNARAVLGNVDIEFDGFLKVSDASEKELWEAANSVKAAEIAADTYARQIDWKRQEMIGLTKDPATGKFAYVNESLAATAETSARQYISLAEAVRKANLGATVENSGLTQDVIDYMMGSANYKRMSAFAKSGGEHAKDAKKSADIIKKDLEALEERIPADVRKKALAYINSSPAFYSELNQYGIAHNYLSKDDIAAYTNKTWAEAGGYQPIITLDNEKNFFLQSKDYRYRATITQDMKSITFKVKPGQHYMDPNIVAQTRLNVAAKSAINRELLDNYVGRVGTSFEEFVSGEQTKFVADVKRGRKDIKASIATVTSDLFMDKNSFGEFVFDKKNATKAMKKTKMLNESQMEEVIGSMSDTDVNRALIDKDRLVRGAAPDSWTREIADEESFKDFYDSLNDSGKAYVDEKCAEFAKGNGDIAIYDNYRQVVSAYGNDFEAGVRRAELAGMPEFKNSRTAKLAFEDLKEGRTAFQDGYAVQKARAHLAGIEGVDVDELSQNLVYGYNEALNDYLDNIKSRKEFQKAVDAFYNGEAAERRAVPSSIVDYFALQELKKKKNLDAFREKVRKPLDDFIEENEKEIINSPNYKGSSARSMANKDMKEYADSIFNDILEDKMNASRLTIEALGMEPIDRKEVYNRAKELHEEILGIERKIDMGATDLDIIAYMDSQGRVAYAQVDPSFASLYSRRTHVPHAERSKLAKGNAILSTIFRKGTTAWNVSSWGNQLFRDYGSALIMGGAWQTIKEAADGMTEAFGKSVVEQLKNFDPEGYELKQVKSVLKRIDPDGKLGMGMDAAAISRELMIGSAKAPSSTEAGLYRRLWDELKKDENVDLDNLEDTLRDKLKKLDPDNLINAKREEYLRNRVYANNLNDALAKGYTLKQARIHAEFAMNNATINFGRQVYHLQSIAESTPYFRAAINGTTSFWRMWSLDPVGISGRIMGGLIIPTIALISHSLSDEENRKVYESIPEWQKRESLVVVINGEAFSLPFPQEMAAVVAPFRQFVEHLYKVDKATFAELAYNDVLGFAPIDLTGFSTMDMNTMRNDPTLASVFSRGFLRVFSQMAPVPLKSTFMLTTGIDPYTGRKMGDAQLWYYDEGSDSAQLLDETQSSFAKTLGEWGLLGRNEYVWSKVLNGVFGTTGVDTLDTLNALFLADNAGVSAAAGTVANALGEAVSKPFTAQAVTADSTWYESVRELTMEKNKITSSKEWKTLNNDLANEKDPEKRKAIIAKRQDLIDEYTVSVMNTTKRLVSKYHGSFDRHKFATVVQLLNFAAEPGFQSGSQFSSDSSTSQYYEGKDLAIQMMSQMNLPMTDDLSVFGYMTTDKDGNPVMKYNQPLAILDAGNTLNNLADYHLANIKAIVSSNNLYDRHQEVTQKINAIYNRGKLTAKDYSEIDALQLHWNAELARAIAPYVQQYGAETALNQKKVRDYLYTYVEVPNYWEVNNKGRSPSLGDRGNRKAAYYDSWIKTVFRVNDPYKGQYGKDLK